MLVLDIVTGSLRATGIIGETQSPSAEQGQAAVTRLNDLMFLWAERGVDLGWNTKATTADTVILPLGWVHGIKAQLGELLSNDYGVDPPVTVLRDADESRNMMNRQALQMAFSPPNLQAMPLGRGSWFDITTGTWR